jgi:hypothetical protein
VITFPLYYVLESSSNSSVLPEICVAFVISLPISCIMFTFVQSLIFVNFLNQFLCMVVLFILFSGDSRPDDSLAD